MHDEHPHDEHVVEYFWNDTFTIVATVFAVVLVLGFLGYLWHRRSHSVPSGKEDYSIGVDEPLLSSVRKSQTRKTYENIQPSEVASVRQKVAIL
jgi:hypothetical protein